MERSYDVVILGAGSAGEVAAGLLADAGLDVAVVEAEMVGGACPFWACMPAKALLRPGQVHAEAQAVPGVRETVGDLDVRAALEWRDWMAAEWDDDGHEASLAAKGIAVVRGHGRLAGTRTVVVGDSLRLDARRAVVIATGSRALIPDIEGGEAVDIWDERSITTTSVAPERMLIIGGGAVGLEMALAWRRLGSREVIVVEREDRPLADEEPFVGREVMAAFETEGIEILTNVEIGRLERDEGTTVARLSDGGERRVDVVVAGAGRRPNTEDIGLDSIGMESGDWIEADEHMRVPSHSEWLFAIGDVNGTDLLTHMGKYEARVAVDVMLGGGMSVLRGRTAVPRVVFIDPLVAAVGSTAEAAAQSGVNVRTVDVDISQQAEALLWGDGTDGTARFVIDDDRGVLVGATFTGPSVLAEIGLAAQMAIVGEVPLEAIRHVVPQFPSFSEIWLDVV